MVQRTDGGRRTEVRRSTLKRAPLFLLLAASAAFGAVDGTVVNATTGKAQAGVTVNLVHPGAGGMETLGSAKSDAAGKFAIDKQVPGPPTLLQAAYDGVTYNQILPPGTPTTGVRLNVYDSTKKTTADVSSQHLLIVEPGSDQLKLSETFLVQNKGNTTFQDTAAGSVQVFLPNGVQPPEVTVTAPGGMPIKRPAEKTSKPDVYKVNYPVKPGETQFELFYTTSDPKKFAGKAVGKDPLRLVTASGVLLSGDGLRDLGTEPRTQAHVYEVSAGSDFSVNIQGTGNLKTEAENDQSDDSGAPKTQPGMARIYDRLGWVLGLTFGMLAIGGTMLYRKGTA